MYFEERITNNWIIGKDIYKIDPIQDKTQNYDVFAILYKLHSEKEKNMYLN